MRDSVQQEREREREDRRGGRAGLICQKSRWEFSTKTSVLGLKVLAINDWLI